MTTDRDDTPRIRRAAELPSPRIVGRRPATRVAAPPVEEVAPSPGPAGAPADEEARPRTRRGSRGGRGRGSSAAALAAEPAVVEPVEAPVAVPDVAPKPVALTPAIRRAAARAETVPTDAGPLAEALRGVQNVLQDLDRRMARLERRQRLGVFVDVPNVIYGAERGERMINMGRLLDMLSEGRELVRATAYSPVSDDPGEPIERQKFVAPFVPHEYRIVTKPLKRFADGSIKGNFDVEMAVDMVTMAERLDVICLVSGDADFARVVEVLQGRGVRVEVVAFENSTSAELRAIADHYIELTAVVDRLR